MRRESDERGHRVSRFSRDSDASIIDNEMRRNLLYTLRSGFHFRWTTNGRTDLDVSAIWWRIYDTRAPFPFRSRRVHKCMVIRYGNEDSISSSRDGTFGKEGALDLQPSRRTTERWIVRKIMPALGNVRVGNGINIDIGCVANWIAKCWIVALLPFQFDETNVESIFSCYYFLRNLIGEILGHLLEYWICILDYWKSFYLFGKCIPYKFCGFSFKTFTNSINIITEIG